MDGFIIQKYLEEHDAPAAVLLSSPARAYNTQTGIIPEAAHNSMLQPNWQFVAERILGWLNERQVAELADVTQL